MEDSMALIDVAAERRRQVEKEGYVVQHDDGHKDRELAAAAGCYVQHYFGRAWVYDSNLPARYQEEPCPQDWPDTWDMKYWKPKSPRQDLVRAAALIVAEIERMDRANALYAKARGSQPTG